MGGGAKHTYPRPIPTPLDVNYKTNQGRYTFTIVNSS